MIDTDKYEGHTEGEWWYVDFTNCPNGSKDSYIMSNTGKVFQNLTGSSLPDELLIADAPLLLAEVKRLRQVVTDLLLEFNIGSSSYWRRIEEDLN